MTHKFIVNTERVNEYGYRILTDGIDTEQYLRNPIVLYGHFRAGYDPNRVVGKCVKLTKVNNELIAEIEFDEKQEFAKDLAGKVERGFIQMSSLHADVKETSTDEALLLPGQTLETVTKCKLVEISIVDIGGNDDALKLSKNGKEVTLAKIKEHKKNENMSIKSIALALGMEENAAESIVLKSVKDLKLAKETAEATATTAQDALKAILGKQADTLVDQAISLGLVPETLKETVRGSFENDHEAQTVKLSKMIADKEEETAGDGVHNVVKEVILGNGDGKGKSVKLTYDYLQKHDVVQLRKIRDTNGAQYAQLVKDFENGVRHTENT